MSLHHRLTAQVRVNISLCLYITVHLCSSLTHSSIKSFSDNLPGQPQSSHSPGCMKGNDIKIKWERPLGARMALQWINPSQPLDSLDVFSPEEASWARVDLIHNHSPPNLHPPHPCWKNRNTDMRPSSPSWIKRLSRCDPGSITVSSLFIVERLMQLSENDNRIKNVCFGTSVNIKRKWNCSCSRGPYVTFKNKKQTYHLFIRLLLSIRVHGV